jgi:hypothetical protein
VTADRGADSPLVHHELCFGCGRQNLFGLLAELRDAGEGRVQGRCFIKQDHQGPEPGNAHPGIIAAALAEAMLLARPDAPLATLEVRFEAAPMVGDFIDLEASAERAVVAAGGRRIATASATRG